MKMRALFLFCLALFTGFALSAQNRWVGGTPGTETDWLQPRNWSKNRVPDWTDSVVLIPDVSTQSGFFPVVSTIVPAIPHLFVASGAKLVLKPSGDLTIDGATTYNHGILLYGEIINSGHLTIQNTGLYSVDYRGYEWAFIGEHKVQLMDQLAEITDH